MKSKFLIYILPVLLVMFLFYGYSTMDNPARDEAINIVSTNTLAQYNSTMSSPPVDVSSVILYNQAELVSNPGGGFGGADASAITAPGTTFGAGNQGPLGNRMGDDFTIPAGETWIIDSIIVFHYQTGSTTTSTFTSVSLQIWDGATPGTGSIVAGDSVTNRLAASYFSNIYRVSATTLTNNQRPIMRNQINMSGTTLTAGTYWIDYAAAGSLASGPWNPPRTIPPDPISGNASQRLGTTFAWAPFLDGVNPQGTPFIVYGTRNTPPINCMYNYYEQPSGVSALLYSVSAVSDRIGWTAGAGAVVRKTTDGGTSWLNANPNPGVIVGDIYNINAWSANDAFITTSPSSTFIYKTSNGGANWTQVYSLAGGFMDAIQMVSPTEGYAVGDPVGGKWVVLKTTDGGSTWNRMATEPTQIGTDAGYNNSFSIVGTNMWFGSTAGTIYHSADLGLTWNFVTAPGVSSVFAVHFNSDLVGMAGGLGPNMVKSSDGGVTFTPTNVPGSSGGLVGISGLNNDIWTVREGTSIYRTTNMGGTWTTGITVASANLKDIDVKNIGGCGYGWSVGAAGKLIRVDGNTVGVSAYSSEVPETYYLQQNYPNPFNPTTNISFSIPTSGLVTLKVYNMAGMEVAKLLNENKTAGSYTIGFDAANLPSGAYFYRLETNSFADTKKMILLK